MSSGARPGGHPSRVLLKLSGEVLGGSAGAGLEADAVKAVADEIVGAARDGAQVAIVVGGGNVVRGASLAPLGFDRPLSDEIGMLGTVVNALALSGAIDRCGHPVRVYSALPAGRTAAPFVAADCRRALDAGAITILAGGTGNPFFSTDTTAALRALEVEASVVLKGTKVDGVYSADPAKDPSAERYETLTLQEAYDRGLAVMDRAALALCWENRLPVRVFDMTAPGNIARALRAEPVGTLVTAD